jgi:hypothetical protein
MSGSIMTERQKRMRATAKRQNKTRLQAETNALRAKHRPVEVKRGSITHFVNMRHYLHPEHPYTKCQDDYNPRLRVSNKWHKVTCVICLRSNPHKIGKMRN